MNTFDVAWQIPSCVERDSALKQLAAQGETDTTDWKPLDFRVRPSTSTDAAATSTAAAGQLVTVQVETACDVTAKGETAEVRAGLDEQGAPSSEFGVDPFFTSCGPLKAKGAESGELDFSVRAPTTSKNLFRVLRALQVRGRWGRLDFVETDLFTFFFKSCWVSIGGRDQRRVIVVVGGYACDVVLLPTRPT